MHFSTVLCSVIQYKQTAELSGLFGLLLASMLISFIHLQAKRKYQEVLEVKNALEADNEELKLKYQSKAQCGFPAGF